MAVRPKVSKNLEDEMGVTYGDQVREFGCSECKVGSARGNGSTGSERSVPRAPTNSQRAVSSTSVVVPIRAPERRTSVRANERDRPRFLQRQNTVDVLKKYSRRRSDFTDESGEREVFGQKRTTIRTNLDQNPTGNGRLEHRRARSWPGRCCRRR